MRLSILAGLLLLNLGLPVSAYQQGSFFLFYLSENVSEEGIAGRKVIAPSIFKTEAAEATTRIAGKKTQKPSEFESGIKSFLGEEKSTSDLQDMGILELEEEAPSSESSFGEDTPAPSGFFFTY